MIDAVHSFDDPPGTALEDHPLASLFPSMEGSEFDAFVEDIREHGVREPICIFEGKILEGTMRQPKLTSIKHTSRDPQHRRNRKPGAPSPRRCVRPSFESNSHDWS
jgi:hypothetical protein